jgi:hypothetical protein
MSDNVIDATEEFKRRADGAHKQEIPELSGRPKTSTRWPTRRLGMTSLKLTSRPYANARNAARSLTFFDLRHAA